jgi:hypothetical protein
MNTNPSANEAITQCFAALCMGVVPCEVKPDTLNGIRAAFLKRFQELLEGDTPKRQWSIDGPRVIRTAYYLGSIAALCAFARGDNEATPDDFKDALSFVQPRCKIRVKKGTESASHDWIYCEGGVQL